VPQGENGEEGEVDVQREKNLQIHEVGSISKAQISVDCFLLAIQSENIHQYAMKLLKVMFLEVLFLGELVFPSIAFFFSFYTGNLIL